MSRRRSGLTFLIVLIVLVGLVVIGLYAADRWGRERVERRIAAELQKSLATPTPPAVHIEGSPFLTQLATRNIRRVQVVADDLGTTTDSALPIAHADLIISDITTTDWYTTMTASHIEGTGLIDYAALQGPANLPLSYEGDGRIRTETTTIVFGQKVVAQITGLPRLDAEKQEITLSDPKITVAGVNLPDFTAQALLRAVITPIPVAGLPLGLRLSFVGAEENSLRAGVVADQVPLNG
jgi:LmeA-like phospholipid-binding